MFLYSPLIPLLTPPPIFWFLYRDNQGRVNRKSLRFSRPVPDRTAPCRWGRNLTLYFRRILARKRHGLIRALISSLWLLLCGDEIFPRSQTGKQRSVRSSSWWSRQQMLGIKLGGQGNGEKETHLEWGG